MKIRDPLDFLETPRKIIFQKPPWSPPPLLDFQLPCICVIKPGGLSSRDKSRLYLRISAVEVF